MEGQVSGKDTDINYQYINMVLLLRHLQMRCRFPSFPLCLEQEHRIEWKCLVQVHTLDILIS